MKPKREFDLGDTLFEIAGARGVTPFTVRMAATGIQVFGGVGSAKTTSSGALIATRYLRYGMGGLVLTVKGSEKDLWVDYCEDTGRGDDVIIVEPGSNGKHRFDFLEYLSQSSGSAFTANIVQVLKTVIRSSEDSAGGKSDDKFWETALDMLLFNIVDLSMLAFKKVNVKTLYDLVQSLPRTDDKRPKEERAKDFFHVAYKTARANIDQQVDEWKKLHPDAKNMEDALPDVRLFIQLDQFFTQTYLELSEKTRSIITFSFAGFLFRLLREPIYSLFCNGNSTFKPEDCWNGKIIIINLPIKEYHKAGAECLILFKYLWQTAMEKRKIDKYSRPVFLFADESQLVLHEYDTEYQATARSSRICTVYLTQNINNYYAQMGGNKSEYRVKGFLGTLANKLFHANADIETNTYASNLIGEEYYEDESSSIQVTKEASISEGRSQKLRKIVRPEQFASLKTGGPENDYMAHVYMHMQGSGFASGLNHEKIKLRQII